MGEGAVKSHGAGVAVIFYHDTGAKHVANMTRSKQLFINLYIMCNLCLHLALFGDIILIVLLRILTFIVRTIKYLVMTLQQCLAWS